MVEQIEQAAHFIEDALAKYIVLRAPAYMEEEQQDAWCDRDEIASELMQAWDLMSEALAAQGRSAGNMRWLDALEMMSARARLDDLPGIRYEAQELLRTTEDAETVRKCLELLRQRKQKVWLPAEIANKIETALPDMSKDEALEVLLRRGLEASA